MVYMKLRIEENQKKGKCGILNDNCKAGDILLRTSPIAAISLTQCAWCFCSIDQHVESRSLKKCSGCHYLKYCSRACQINDWNQFHKAECNNLKILSNRPTVTLMLISRILRKLSYSSDTYENIRNLTHHLRDHNPDQLQRYIEMAQLVLRILGISQDSHDTNKEKHWNIPDIVKLFGQVYCNGFSICNQEFETVGLGLYPEASIFNHSCNPNSIICFNNRELILRALKPISKDEEITICYTEVLYARSMRKRTLKSSYFFNCTCERCYNQETQFHIYWHHAET